METKNKISKEDVVDIATSIGKVLTDEEIQDIVESYWWNQEEDPTATWNLVVEDMIYFIILHR